MPILLKLDTVFQHFLLDFWDFDSATRICIQFIENVPNFMSSEIFAKWLNEFWELRKCELVLKLQDA